MVYTFARIHAVLEMKVADYFIQGRIAGMMKSPSMAQGREERRQCFSEAYTAGRKREDPQTYRAAAASAA